MRMRERLDHVEDRLNAVSEMKGPSYTALMDLIAGIRGEQKRHAERLSTIDDPHSGQLRYCRRELAYLTVRVAALEGRLDAPVVASPALRPEAV